MRRRLEWRNAEFAAWETRVGPLTSADDHNAVAPENRCVSCRKTNAQNAVLTCRPAFALCDFCVLTVESFAPVAFPPMLLPLPPAMMLLRLEC